MFSGLFGGCGVSFKQSTCQSALIDPAVQRPSPKAIATPSVSKSINHPITQSSNHSSHESSHQRARTHPVGRAPHVDADKGVLRLGHTAEQGKGQEEDGCWLPHGGMCASCFCSRCWCHIACLVGVCADVCMFGKVSVCAIPILLLPSHRSLTPRPRSNPIPSQSIDQWHGCHLKPS